MATTKRVKKSTDVISPTNNKGNHHAPDFIQLVKQRAYFIYNERVKHNLPGDELHDWLKAENEVKQQFSDS